jgi:type IV secretion system protein VirB8
VRYERIVRSNDGRESMSRWVATMSFGFVEAPMSERDRLINPRGFTVRDYRLDEETR